MAGELGHPVGRARKDVQTDDDLHLGAGQLAQPAPVGSREHGGVQDEIEGDIGAELGECPIGMETGRPDPASHAVDPLDRGHDASAFTGDA